MATFEHNNFVYLTGSLIVLLLCSALIDSLPYGTSHLFLQAIVLLTYTVAYFSLNFGRQWRIFIVVIFFLLLCSSAFQEFATWRFSSLVDLTLMLLFFVNVTYRSSLQILFSGKIDGNIIVGSCALFILLGLIWAILYLMLLEISPTAFSGIAPVEWSENFSVVSYFSFVTLITLGYGDISPTEPLSRTLVYFEAIAGVFYMAVIVASLVGAKRNTSKLTESTIN